MCGLAQMTVILKISGGIERLHKDSECTCFREKVCKEKILSSGRCLYGAVDVSCSLNTVEIIKYRILLIKKWNLSTVGYIFSFFLSNLELDPDSAKILWIRIRNTVLYA